MKITVHIYFYLILFFLDEINQKSDPFDTAWVNSSNDLLACRPIFHSQNQMLNDSKRTFAEIEFPDDNQSKKPMTHKAPFSMMPLSVYSHAKTANDHPVEHFQTQEEDNCTQGPHILPQDGVSHPHIEKCKKSRHAAQSTPAARAVEVREKESMYDYDCGNVKRVSWSEEVCVVSHHARLHTHTSPLSSGGRAADPSGGTTRHLQLATPVDVHAWAGPQDVSRALDHAPERAGQQDALHRGRGQTHPVGAEPLRQPVGQDRAAVRRAHGQRAEEPVPRLDAAQGRREQVLRPVPASDRPAPAARQPRGQGQEGPRPAVQHSEEERALWCGGARAR